MRDSHRLTGNTLAPGSPCMGIVSKRGCSTNRGSIFVTSELDFEDYAAICQSAAVITETGGQTNHLAVVCRIKGIPLLLVPGAERMASCRRRGDR